MAMNPGMKMLMMERVRQPQNNNSEYGGGNRRMIGYDRNGERNMPSYNMYNGMEPESRRRRDSRGRYMMGGNPHMMDDDYDEDDMRSQTWEPPHMKGGSGSRYGFGDVYANIDATGAMNRSRMMGGDMSELVDEHTARMWVQDMKQPKGGKPMPAFKIEETEAFRKTCCPECNMWEFFVAMNMRYSDEFEVAKKFGVDRPEYYADLAKSFLTDEDAGPHKLRKYMTIIPR